MKKKLGLMLMTVVVFFSFSLPVQATETYYYEGTGTSWDDGIRGEQQPLDLKMEVSDEGKRIIITYIGSVDQLQHRIEAIFENDEHYPWTVIDYKGFNAQDGDFWGFSSAGPGWSADQIILPGKDKLTISGKVSNESVYNYFEFDFNLVKTVAPITPPIENGDYKGKGSAIIKTVFGEFNVSTTYIKALVNNEYFSLSFRANKIDYQFNQLKGTMTPDGKMTYMQEDEQSITTLTLDEQGLVVGTITHKSGGGSMNFLLSLSKK